MPTAAAIVPAIVAAGASIYSANKQTSTTRAVTNQQIQASNEAARIEEETAKRQEAFLREQDEKDRIAAENARKQEYDAAEYERKYGYAASEAKRQDEYNRYISRQNNLRPYLGMGQSATGNLSHLMGLSPASMQTPDPATTNPYQPLPPYQPVPYTPNSTASAIPGPTGTTQTPTAPATAPQPQSFLPTDEQRPIEQTQTPQSGAELVWMEAPDGTRKQVPPFSVPYFENLGATVLQ